MNAQPLIYIRGAPSPTCVCVCVMGDFLLFYKALELPIFIHKEEQESNGSILSFRISVF